MTCKELMDYLSGFDPDENVAALIADLKTRTAYPIGAYQLVTDAGFPALMFELGEGQPLDDMLEEVQ